LFFDCVTEKLSELPLFKPTVRHTPKLRTIWEPNDAMRLVHERFAEMVKRARNFPHYLPRTIAENVYSHGGSRFFYLTDLVDAYGSVPANRLVPALCRLNPDWWPVRRELGQLLEQYFLLPGGGLYTGGPASPTLFNAYAAMVLDVRLYWWCSKRGISYTRYMDDLTFSRGSGYPLAKYRLGPLTRKTIRRHIEQAGFKVNHRKSGLYDLKHGAVTITGLELSYREVVSWPSRPHWKEIKNRVSLSRSYLHKLRNILAARLRGEEARDSDGTLITDDQITGMMSYFWAPWGGKLPDHAIAECLTQREKEVLKLYTTWKATV
jgi:hypothetical protein